MKKSLIIFALSVLSVFAYSQTSIESNNSVTNSDFLGWNSAPFDLNIRHNQNYGINWFTNNTRRMRMFPSQNVTINQGQFTTNTEGRLMLSSQSFLFNTVKPLSLLHLVGDDGWLEFTYRPWMDDGLSLTANGDAMWMGLKDEGPDFTEAVMAWGDNSTTTNGPDDMTFRFLANYVGSATNDESINSLDGLQIMRLSALDNGRVGIGNIWDATTTRPQRRLHVNDGGNDDLDDAQLRLSYDALNTYTDMRVSSSGDFTLNPRLFQEERNVGIHVYNPTEKLDVSGNARFRGIEGTPGNALITGFEESASPGDYSLRYLEFSNDPQTFLNGDGEFVTLDPTGGEDCDWETNGVNVWTGIVEGCLPTRSVGIGTNSPLQKLHVQAQNVPQLRLSHSATTAYTNFRSLDSGDLNITPYSGVGQQQQNRFVGIHVANASEMLDVNGTARLRNMGSATPNVLITGVEETGQGDYSLNHLEFTGNANQFLDGNGNFTEVNTSDCDWQISGQNLYTGIPNDPDCFPNSNVGIGIVPDIAKFQIQYDASEEAGVPIVKFTDVRATGTGIIFGSLTSMTTDTPQVGDAIAFQTTVLDFKTSVGHRIAVEGDLLSRGVDVICDGPAQAFGVDAQIADAQSVNFQAAIRGRVTGNNANGGNKWAAYFDGNTFHSTGIWQTSDSQFKQDIADVSGLELLNELTPKQYVYNTEAYPDFGFNNNLQYGFLAQELEEAAPNLVMDTKRPDVYDEEGNFVEEGLEFKAVNYTGIIPINTAAIKEQQAIITTQQQQIDDLTALVNTLTEAVNLCCATDIVPKTGNELENDIQLEQKESSLDQNKPNPFDQQTTITYNLAQAGKAVVSIFNQNGQLIETLSEAQQDTGTYSIQWNASNLASGIYFYSLSIDGVELVKRAVKL